MIKLLSKIEILPRGIIFIVIAIIIIVFLGFSMNKSRKGLIIGKPAGSSYSILFKDDGFYPAELTIQQGDIIVFTTKTGRHFWPASDLHPTHSIYPKFDPQEPIEASKSWSFKFDKVGEWRFHNHLEPYFRGIIKVIKNNEQSTYDCWKNDNNLQKCWQDQTEQALKTKGVAAAFDVIADLYQKEPKFGELCHSLVHEVGEKSYELFSKHKDFTVTPKSTSCAYGFYHGFMEAMLKKTSDLKEAESFCNYIDKQLSSQTPDVSLQCYHGIGHGVTNPHDDKSTWGDDEAIISPALKLCERVSKNDNQLYRCSSGVFNAIANFYISGQYKLVINRKDPAWICHKQPERYKESCYGNMNSLFMSLADNKLVKAASYIDNIVDDGQAISAMKYLSALNVLSNLNITDYDVVFDDCRSLAKRLYIPCINGFAHGLLEHGFPGKEYVKALEFCRMLKILKEEKDSCFKYVLSNLTGWYPADKAKEICKGIEVEYQNLCKKS